MDLRKVLGDLGLNQKEVKVYLALLELSEALPSVIAKMAAIKRPTTYLILDQLKSKGLVSRVKKGAYFYFQPITPHFLVEDQYRKLTNIEEALPELLSLHDKYAVRPYVSIFEGENGLISIMQDTLSTSTDILTWADVSLATQTVLKDYYPSYIKEKVKRNIWNRGIVVDEKFGRAYQSRGDLELRELYLIPKEDYPFKNEINIYDDKMVIISHKDLIGVVIQNKSIADTQRSIFNFAFKYAKLLDSKATE